MSMSMKEKKLAAYRQSRAEDQRRFGERRARRRRERKCWWTWPLGHVYVAEERHEDGMRRDRRCAGCGKLEPIRINT
jgi:hypothetical protein